MEKSELYNHLVLFTELEGTEVGEEIAQILTCVKTLGNVPPLDTFDANQIQILIDDLLLYCKEWVLYCLFDCEEDCELPEEEIQYWKSLL